MCRYLRTTIHAYHITILYINILHVESCGYLILPHMVTTSIYINTILQPIQILFFAAPSCLKEGVISKKKRFLCHLTTWFEAMWTSCLPAHAAYAASIIFGLRFGSPWPTHHVDGDIRTSAAEQGPVMSGAGKQSGRGNGKGCGPGQRVNFFSGQSEGMCNRLAEGCWIRKDGHGQVSTVIYIYKHVKSVSRRSLQSGQSALRTVASTPSLIDLYLRISSPEPNAFGKEDLLFDRFHQEDTMFWFQPGKHVSLPLVDHRGLVEETNASDEISQYFLEGRFHLHEGCLKPPKRPHSFSTVFYYISLYIHIIIPVSI